MELEIRHLQMVQAINEEGTVTRAAIRLHLTQSALSHQLLGIEERLNTPLFERLGKQMQITAAGERLLRAGTVVLAELEGAVHDIEQRASARDAILRVSTECYTCYHWLPSQIQRFNQKCPRIEVRIVLEATHEAHQALLERKIDVAIVSTRWKNAELKYTPLFRDELVVITSPRHRLAAKSYIEPEELRSEHLLVYDVPRDQLTVFSDVLNPAGVMPRAVSHVPLTEAIIEMVKGNVGVGVLAYWAVEPYVKAGTVAALSLSRKAIRRQWCTATLRNRATPTYVKTFVECLRHMQIEPAFLL